MNTPATISAHDSKFKTDAWKEYTPAELGAWVSLLVKRASHRASPEKAGKDLTDAQNYLDMLQAHVDEAVSLYTDPRL